MSHPDKELQGDTSNAETTSPDSSALNGTESSTGQSVPKEEGPLATAGEKILLFLALVLATAPALYGSFELFDRVESMLQTTYAVNWKMPPGIAIQSGPASFWYDSAEGVLRHRGPIDNKRKQELIGLLAAISCSSM